MLKKSGSRASARKRVTLSGPSYAGGVGPASRDVTGVARPPVPGEIGAMLPEVAARVKGPTSSAGEPHRPCPQDRSEPLGVDLPRQRLT
jgi:hypothetical protein